MTAREKLMFRVSADEAERLRRFAAMMGFQTDSDALRALIVPDWQIDLIGELGRWYQNSKSATESFLDFVAFAATRYMSENGGLRIHPIQAGQATTEATIRLFTAAMKAARGEPGFKLVPCDIDRTYNFVQIADQRDIRLDPSLEFPE